MNQSWVLALLILGVVGLSQGKRAGEGNPNAGQCAKLGQLCGKLVLEVPTMSISVEASFTQECCTGYECDHKIEVQGTKGGICKPAGAGDQNCVGHKMPCGEWKSNGKKLDCCAKDTNEADAVALKCDTAINVGPFKGGLCLKDADSANKKCVLGGFPCGNAKNIGDQWVIDCCEGFDCDTKGVLDIKGFKLGFCRGKKGGWKDDDNAGVSTTQPPSKPDKDGAGHLLPGLLAVFSMIGLHLMV